MAREVKLILDLDTGRIKQDSKQAAKSVGKIDDSVKRTERSTNALNSAWKKFGGVVAGLAVGELIRRGFTRSIQKGKELQQSLADLSAITGISGEALDDLGESALDSSVEFGTAANNIVEAQKLVASQLAEKIDFGTAEGLQQLKEIANQATLLKTAAGIDLRTAVEATAGAINQFNLEAEESERVINVLAAGAKFGAAEVRQQAEALRDAGTAANSAGISIEETQSAIQRLAQANIVGARAGTGLRNVFVRLQTRTKELAEAGFEVNTAQDGLVGTLQKLQPLAGDTVTLTKIFGEEAQALADILLQDVDALGEFTEKVTGTNVATEQAATQLNTLEGSLGRLEAALDKELITAFQQTDGALMELVETGIVFIQFTADGVRGINSMVQSFNRMADAVGTTSLLIDKFTDFVLPLRLMKTALEQLGIIEDTTGKWQDFFDTIDDGIEQIEAAASNIADEAVEFKNLRDELDQTNPKYESFNRLIESNRDELLKMKSIGESNIERLQAEREGLVEGTDAYVRNTELLRQNREGLVAVNAALETVNGLQKTNAENTNAAANAAKDAAESTNTLASNLTSQKEALNGILNTSGELTKADRERAIELQKEIDRLEAIIERRQKMIEMAARSIAFDLPDQRPENPIETQQAPDPASVSDPLIQSEQAKRDAIMETQRAWERQQAAAAKATKTGTEGAKAEASALETVAAAGFEAAAAAAMRGDNVTESVREIIKALAVEIVALQVRNVVATVPFPLNVAIAGTAAALTASLFDKLVPEFQQGGPTGRLDAEKGGPLRGGRRIISVNEDGRSEYILNADTTNAAPRTIDAMNADPEFARAMEKTIFTAAPTGKTERRIITPAPSRPTGDARFSEGGFTGAETIRQIETERVVFARRQTETGADIPTRDQSGEDITAAIIEGLKRANVIARVSLSQLDDELNTFRTTERRIGNES